MAKKHNAFVCSNCGHSMPRWQGCCPECELWNTFVDEGNDIRENLRTTGNIENESVKLNSLILDDQARLLSGLVEFDRVMGKGITKGSLNLLAGEPGIGKSTLLMQVVGSLARGLNDKKILYVTGEESIEQVFLRAKRMGINEENILVLNERPVENIINHCRKIKPELLVIDSIQTLISQDTPYPCGSIGQIREVTYEIMHFIKRQKLTTFLIGHITKEGSIAGPKLLEHIVDAVLYIEGEEHGPYRLLRAVKNRFGNTSEIGVFNMSERGLFEVSNHSLPILKENISESYGRAFTCITEGSRVIFIEVQALVIENKYGNGKRNTQGFDQNRLGMLIAVIEKYFEIPLSLYDVYINVIGRIKIKKRELDLPVIVSILGSLKKQPIKQNLLFLGEVGLTSEVRSVSQIESILNELNHLGDVRVVTCSKSLEESHHLHAGKQIGLDKATELEQLLFN